MQHRLAYAVDGWVASAAWVHQHEQSNAVDQAAFHRAGAGKPYGHLPEGVANMDLSTSSKPTLHVFNQEGGWHWGITVERAAGGMKVVAYSDEGFDSEEEAREDGEHVLRSEDWRSRQSFSRSERRQGYP
jgi:hypothetical protein